MVDQYQQTAEGGSYCCAFLRNRNSTFFVAIAVMAFLNSPKLIFLEPFVFTCIEQVMFAQIHRP